MNEYIYYLTDLYIEIPIIKSFEYQVWSTWYDNKIYKETE